MEAVPNVAKADGQLTVEQSRWSAERSTDGITRVPLSLFTIWHERTCEEFDTTGQFAVFLTAHVGGIEEGQILSQFSPKRTYFDTKKAEHEFPLLWTI